MTNARVSSPSPPFEASSFKSPSALLVGWHIVFALPRRLWDAYMTYLWYYQPDSWVGRVASSFRILAIVLVLPVVFLTLLDVTSYVIARTLGVDDDVKASTSDAGGMEVAGTVPVSPRRPTVFMSEGPVRGSEDLAAEDSVEGGREGVGRGDGRVPERVVRSMSATVHAQTRGQGQMEMETKPQVLGASQPAYYFAGDEGLGLAGEGVFSPAVSMPPSPLTPHMPFEALNESGSGQMSEEEGIVLRRRVPGRRVEEPVHT